MELDATNTPKTVRLSFEGTAIEAPAGATVAAALLAADIIAFGTRPVSGLPRGAFCMMGTCFECMVEIDGIANRQACLETVQEGQNIRRMPPRIPTKGQGDGDD